MHRPCEFWIPKQHQQTSTATSPLLPVRPLFQGLASSVSVHQSIHPSIHLFSLASAPSSVHTTMPRTLIPRRYQPGPLESSQWSLKRAYRRSLGVNALNWSLSVQVSRRMARLAPESRLSLLDDRRVLGLEPGGILALGSFWFFGALLGRFHGSCFLLCLASLCDL